jgi:hypothetical protein
MSRTLAKPNFDTSAVFLLRPLRSIAAILAIREAFGREIFLRRLARINRLQSLFPRRDQDH